MWRVWAGGQGLDKCNSSGSHLITVMVMVNGNESNDDRNLPASFPVDGRCVQTGSKKADGG